MPKGKGKTYSPKQKKIAKVASPKNRINKADFEVLRRGKGKKTAKA